MLSDNIRTIYAHIAPALANMTSDTVNELVHHIATEHHLIGGGYFSREDIENLNGVPATEANWRAIAAHYNGGEFVDENLNGANYEALRTDIAEQVEQGELNLPDMQ